LTIATRFVLIFFVLIAARAAADTTSNAVKVQALFTPGDNIAGAIVQAIRDAKQSVRVQCFSFTNKAIGRALQDAQQRRIDVAILADQEQFEKGAAFILRDLKQAGVAMKLDGSHSAAHNKIMLIDDEGANPKIITGSFNFTQAAQKYNAENVVLIHNDKTLAKAYRDNWLRHWQHGVAVE
jgi:phosphatidylserine/phosphatidylglycerophosphate/cardiolipin synthase-like enzyme